MPKPQLHAQADHMAIRQQKSNKEIAIALGVSESTIARWAKKRDWHQRREQWVNSSAHIGEKLLNLLSQEVQNLDALSNSDVDKIMKAVKAIKSLDADVDMLSTTILVLEQFSNFLHARHSKFFSDFQDILPSFLIYMREKHKAR